MISESIQKTIAAEKLPAEFSNIVRQCYSPIAAELADIKGDTPFVLGVQGCQGSGKSTLSLFLKVILESEYSLKTAILSIDDFYLTKAQREDLARTVHPLLRTRGVPGTHDVGLAIETIAALTQLKDGESFEIPRFDKAADDRAAKESWESISGPVDIVILEGWCVGLTGQLENQLIDPMNDLEINEDPDGSWRRYVNQQLLNDYQDLFNTIEKLVVLQAPSFDCVKNWRSLQEQKLAETVAKLPEEERAKKKIMSDSEVLRFISHYQRLTKHALSTLPERADWLLQIDEDHNLTLIKTLTRTLEEK